MWEKISLSLKQFLSKKLFICCFAALLLCLLFRLILIYTFSGQSGFTFLKEKRNFWLVEKKARSLSEVFLPKLFNWCCLIETCWDDFFVICFETRIDSSPPSRWNCCRRCHEFRPKREFAEREFEALEWTTDKKPEPSHPYKGHSRRCNFDWRGFPAAA